MQTEKYNQGFWFYDLYHWYMILYAKLSLAEIERA